MSALSFTQQRKQTQLSSVVSTDSDTTTDQGGIIAIEIDNERKGDWEIDGCGEAPFHFSDRPLSV